MITAEEFIRNEYESYDNELAAINCEGHHVQFMMNEFAKEAIKADRINLLEHIEYTYDSANNVVIDKESLLNAPNIQLV